MLRQVRRTLNGRPILSDAENELRIKLPFDLEWLTNMQVLKKSPSGPTGIAPGVTPP